MQERFTGLVLPRVASGSGELLGERKSLSSVIQLLLSCALMESSHLFSCRQSWLNSVDYSAKAKTKQKDMDV